MKKITLILGLVLTLVIGIVMLNPIQEQIETVSTTTEEIDYYKDNLKLGQTTTSLSTNNNNLYIWGYQYNGALGAYYENDQLTPILVDIPEGENLLDFQLGDGNGILITTSNKLYVWGSNAGGVLGYDPQINSSFIELMPLSIPNNETFSQLSLKENHIGLITEEGNLYMWGRNTKGQLGDGTEIDKYTPTLITIPNNETPKQVSLGTNHSGLITEEGNLYMWGGNLNGKLGDGTETDRNTPTLITIPNNETPKQLSLGGNHTGLITEEGNLYMWGSNNQSQLGDGTVINKDTPTLITIPNNETPKQVSLNGNFSGLITEEGNLYMWGRNTSAQLGDGTEINKDTPTLITIPNNESPKQLSLGGNHTGLITEEGNLYMWGINIKGQLGLGDIDKRLTPTQIPSTSFNDESLLVVDYTETITVVNEAPYIKLLAILPMVLVAGLVVLTTLGVKKEYF